ncbi:methyltransferase [Scytonema sp. PCC 10023]|uniref:MstO n=1 Tax=Scytonema sp. PCC 10023 TaxID=1680591 RepID=A0A2D1CM93_9CYAN|nr:MstO [Scytonema sp. PCC 10023]
MIKENPYIQKIASSAQDFLFFMIGAHGISQAIAVASRLGIPDLLSSEPKTVTWLAEKLECDRDNLERLLLCLCDMGFFTFKSDETIALNEVSEFLKSDHPQSLAVPASIRSYEYDWMPWGELYNTVKNGGVCFERVFHTDFYSYLSKNPEINQLFNKNMGNITRLTLFDSVVALLNVNDINHIVDVGGGKGDLIITLLKKNEHLKGTIFDQIHLESQAKKLILEHNLENRCEWIGGDFFQGIPSADALILSEILHGWNDVQALEIIKNCRKSISNKGKIFLIERVIDSKIDSHNIGDKSRNLINLTMAVFTGGKERTEGELRKLLEEAQFALEFIQPIKGWSGLKLIQAKSV